MRFPPMPLTANGVVSWCMVLGTATPALAARSRREDLDSLTVFWATASFAFAAGVAPRSSNGCMSAAGSLRQSVTESR